MTSLRRACQNIPINYTNQTQFTYPTTHEYAGALTLYPLSGQYHFEDAQTNFIPYALMARAKKPRGTNTRNRENAQARSLGVRQGSRGDSNS